MDTQNDGLEKVTFVLNMWPFLDVFVRSYFDMGLCYALISCKGCHNKSISNIISNITSNPCRKSYQDHIPKVLKAYFVKAQLPWWKSLVFTEVSKCPMMPEKLIHLKLNRVSLDRKRIITKDPYLTSFFMDMFCPTPKWQIVPRCVAPFSTKHPCGDSSFAWRQWVKGRLSDTKFRVIELLQENCGQWVDRSFLKEKVRCLYHGLQDAFFSGMHELNSNSYQL